jgi:osmotically-inducible protein OsmY
MTDRAAHEIQRPDADVFVDARNALDQRASVPATVRVHVDRGVVTLTGSVRSPLERAEAADVVRHIAGVQRLVNEIVVSQIPNPEGFESPEGH